MNLFTVSGGAPNQSLDLTGLGVANRNPSLLRRQVSGTTFGS
jgi:hypothetical protein